MTHTFVRNIAGYSQYLADKKKIEIKPEKTQTELKEEIEIKLLQKIADYYEFPLAVFFMQEKDFPTDAGAKTRTEGLRRQILRLKEELNKIIDKFL